MASACRATRCSTASAKLQGSALLFCFGVMALLGLGAQLTIAAVLPATLALGFLFLGILPSTVQSATAASSMAGGNVAASVVAAALLNLTGVIASPLLFAALAGSAGEISGAAALRIVAILLLPFVVGQLAQRWLRPWVLTHKGLTTIMDRTAIAVAVYVAFSAAVVAGIARSLLCSASSRRCSCCRSAELGALARC